MVTLEVCTVVAVHAVVCLVWTLRAQSVLNSVFSWNYVAIWNGNIFNDFESCRDQSRTALLLCTSAVPCLWCGFAQSCA